MRREQMSCRGQAQGMHASIRPVDVYSWVIHARMTTRQILKRPPYAGGSDLLRHATPYGTVTWRYVAPSGPRRPRGYTTWLSAMMTLDIECRRGSHTLPTMTGLAGCHATRNRPNLANLER
jgi:hypothetical protein